MKTEICKTNFMKNLNKYLRLSIIACVFCIGVVVLRKTSLSHLIDKEITETSYDKIISLYGILFTIVGVVATFYFVVLTYKARKIHEDLNDVRRFVRKQIKEEKKVIEKTISLSYKVMYDNLSCLLNDNPSQFEKYKLQQARLGCMLPSLDEDQRVWCVSLVGDLQRNSPTSISEIPNDIELLNNLLKEEDLPQTVLDAAITSIYRLKNESTV